MARNIFVLFGFVLFVFIWLGLGLLLKYRRDLAKKNAILLLYSFSDRMLLNYLKNDCEQKFQIKVQYVLVHAPFYAKLKPICCDCTCIWLSNRLPKTNAGNNFDVNEKKEEKKTVSRLTLLYELYSQ